MKSIQKVSGKLVLYNSTIELQNAALFLTEKASNYFETTRKTVGDNKHLIKYLEK